MPPKPPNGKRPAVASQGTPGSVIGVVVVAVVVVVGVLFALDLTGQLAAIGPLRYGLFGLTGALAVTVPRHFSYAAGEDWFRRGNYWVDTAELTEARLDRQTLRLRDSSSRRKVSVPLDVLTGNQQLFAALAAGVRHSHASGRLQADDSARGFFSLPAAA